MRQLYLDWVNWWFDHPALFVAVGAIALAALYVSHRFAK